MKNKNPFDIILQYLNWFFILFLFLYFSETFAEIEITTSDKEPAQVTPYFLQEFYKTGAGQLLAHPQSLGPYPLNYHEAIHGVDAPIELIQLRHQQSYQYWSTSTLDLRNKSFEGFKSIQIDIETLKDLNQMAYHVWNEWVELNDQNPQVARSELIEWALENSVLTSPTSHTSTGHIKITLDKIKELSSNVIAFLQNMNSDWVTPLPSEENKNFYRSIFKNVHPLLIQLIMNEYSHFAYTVEECFLQHAQSESIFSERWTDESCYPEDVLTMRQNTTLTIGNEFSNSLGMVSQANMVFVKNARALLEYLNDSKNDYPCSLYGLWPNLNRILLYGRTFIFGGYGTTFLNNYTDSQVQQNCGLITGHTQNIYGPLYGQIWFLHRRNLQILSSKLIQ